MNDAVLSALNVFFAILLYALLRETSVDRLARFDWLSHPTKGELRDGLPHSYQVGLAGDGAESSGMLDFIDAVRAHVQSGGALNEAFAKYAHAGQISSTATLPSVVQLRTILEECSQPGESAEQIRRVAVELDLACHLSEALGCEASRCLDAVADSYRRMRLLGNLVDNAMSVPRSTVKLLTALPLATLLLAELLGVHPLSFLLGTWAGRICLVLGMLVYGIGLEWINILMESVDTAM